MSSDSGKHILTVVVDPACEYCASTNPEDWCTIAYGKPIQCISWSVACPGLTESCRVWWECMECKSDEARDALDEDPVRHGVEHRQFSMGWATPGKTCVYLVDPVDDVIGGIGPEPGEYSMVVDWADDLPEVDLTPLSVNAP